MAHPDYTDKWTIIIKPDKRPDHEGIVYINVFRREFEPHRQERPYRYRSANDVASVMECVELALKDEIHMDPSFFEKAK